MVESLSPPSPERLAAPDEKYLSPKWRPVLQAMDLVDVEGRSSPNALLNSAEWIAYHIPTQQEFYPFPNDDGDLSDHQRFYFEAAFWVDKLADGIDVKYLTNFPQRFGQGDLGKLDPKMSNIIMETANLLTRTDDGHTLKFTLTDENYAKLDTKKNKLAAFLLLRLRLANRVGGAINTLLLATQKVGINYDGNVGLAKMYDAIKKKGDSLRPLDDEYFNSPMGGVRTIDWLDQLYRHPLLTNTNEVYAHGTNKVREEFLKKIPGLEIPQEPEASALGKLFNIAFEQVGLDAERPDFRSQRRVGGKPIKLSQKGKDWAKDFYLEAKRQGYNPEEIQQEIGKMSQHLKDENNKKTQTLLLRSLTGRNRRDAEADLRREITETRGKWWQKLGLSPFEINYLTEMELARRKSGGVERLTRDVSQLKKEIEAGLKRKISSCRKWARGRIGKRLKQLAEADDKAGVSGPGDTLE